MNYCPAFYANSHQIGKTIHVGLMIPLASHISYLETGYLFFAN